MASPSELEVAAWRHLFVANMFGGILVTTYLVASAPADVRAAWWQPGVTFAAFVVVLAPLTRWHTHRTFASVRSWLTVGRVPSERERAAALGIPNHAAFLVFAYWIAIALTTGVIVGGVGSASGTRAVALVAGTVLAGAAASVLSHVVVERDLRPVFALALREKPPERAGTFGIHRRLVLFWVLGSGIPLAGILISPLAYDTSARGLVSAVSLAAIALVAGLGFTVVAARSVAEPLEDVRSVLDQVGIGRLDVELAVDDDGEIGRLKAGVNRMVVGLRERERLHDLFGRHVGVDVARAALERGVKLGGEVREIAVLFVDVVGSTALAASRPPTEVVGLLNRFFAVAVDVVATHDGFVNKFEGDAALAVFGAPLPLGDAAGHALAAARMLRARLEDEVPDCQAGIGVAAGPAVAGNIGEERRFEYTVIGDPVNEAARLTEIAKSMPGRVVASAAIVERASPSEAEHWALGDSVTLRGRTSPTRVATPS